MKIKLIVSGALLYFFAAINIYAGDTPNQWPLPAMSANAKTFQKPTHAVEQVKNEQHKTPISFLSLPTITSPFKKHTQEKQVGEQKGEKGQRKAETTPPVLKPTQELLQELSQRDNQAAVPTTPLDVPKEKTPKELLQADEERKGERKEQQQESLTPEKLRRIKEAVARDLLTYSTLFESSKGKDIVVFIGKTGSGKSTLINYLSNKDLIVNDDGDVVLKDPTDKCAMAIGVGAVSQTRMPQFANIWYNRMEMLFYDLPGLDDTEGTTCELTNAFFIKHIIEQAKSIRLIAVASLSEAISGRGRSFKDLASRIKGLFPPNINISGCSSCIITKSDIPTDRLIPYLEKKVDKENLSLWVEGPNPRISQMSKPKGTEIDFNEVDSIMRTISSTNPVKINENENKINININMRSLYSYESSSVLEGMTKKQTVTFLDRLIQNVEEEISTAEDKAFSEAEEDARHAFQKRFGKQLELYLGKINTSKHAFQTQLRGEIANSQFLKLLGSFLDKNVYEGIISSVEDDMELQRVNIESDIQIKKLEPLKIKIQRDNEA